MGLLTDKEVRQYLLAHGKVYIYSCDDCQEKLIAAGELCVVLKWTKRTDGNQAMMGKIPVKVRCMECHLWRNPPKEKLDNRKITSGEAASVGIHPVIQKIVLSLIKHNEIERDKLKFNLMKKKAIRELKKSDVSRTVRGLKEVESDQDQEWNLDFDATEKKEGQTCRVILDHCSHKNILGVSVLQRGLDNHRPL